MIALLITLVVTIDMLTMGGPIVNSIIVTSVVLAFATGVVLALVWRRTRPAVYARIGGSEAA
jgi:uncharacterized protein (DUF2062 family)